jgi:hypothetical protein
VLRSAFNAVDQWLDAWAERHSAAIGTVWLASGFVLLVGGVGYHAERTGFAGVIVSQCGAACAGIPGTAWMAAAVCGMAAILLIALLAALAAGLQRTLLDPWQFVRPGLKPVRLPRWLIGIGVVLGVALFFVIAALGPDRTPDARHAIRIADDRMLALILGWCVGGMTVLKFFWIRARRRDAR